MTQGEKTFEELFPELNKKIYDEDIWDEVMQHCLSKARVRAVLLKHEAEESWPCMQEVLKELGLNE